MAKDLTTKQKKFIEAYNGNGVEAARVAGYQGTDATLSQIAHENLRKPEIAQAIKERETKELNRIVMNRLDRQIWWTEVMKDKNIDIKARLKASELLGKSEADFTEKVDVNLHGELGDRLEEAIKNRDGDDGSNSGESN